MCFNITDFFVTLYVLFQAFINILRWVPQLHRTKGLHAQERQEAFAEPKGYLGLASALLCLGLLRTSVGLMHSCHWGPLLHKRY